MARSVRLAAAAALLLFACSCGSNPQSTGVVPGPAATSRASDAGTGDAGQTAAGQTGGGGQAAGQTDGGQTGGGGQAAGQTRGGGGDDGFAYTPWGPDDPPIPTQYAVLAASTGHPPRCSDLSDNSPGGTFWSTVLEVCDAITGAGPWPQADAAPPPPDAENAYQACLNTELSDMLDRALRWHALNPGARPVVAYPARSSRSPCQYRIYGIDVLGPRSSFSGESPAGKVPLAILVGGIEGTPDDLVVTVDGARAEETSDYFVQEPGDGMTALFVLADQTLQPHRAVVAVSFGGRTMTSSVDLPGGAPISSATTTPTRSAAQSPPPSGRSARTTSEPQSSTSTISQPPATSTTSEPQPATSTTAEPTP